MGEKMTTTEHHRSLYFEVKISRSTMSLSAACRMHGISIPTYYQYRKQFEPQMFRSMRTANSRPFRPRPSKSSGPSPYPITIDYKLEPTAVIRVGNDTVIEVPTYKEKLTLLKWKQLLKNWNRAEETKRSQELT